MVEGKNIDNPQSISLKLPTGGVLIKFLIFPFYKRISA